MTAYWSAFLIGFALLFAIGAQNAFVLRLGLMRRHVFAIALFCALSDAVLIASGVAGLSWLITGFVTQFESHMFGIAALWLLGYAALRLRDVIRGNQMELAGADHNAALWPTLMTAAIMTFGNPHVYLDTVVLIGTISLQFEGISKLQFGAGAVTASFVFFFGLAYGASLLAPFMQRPGAWRVFDGVIALIMVIMAFGMARAGGWV